MLNQVTPPHSVITSIAKVSSVSKLCIAMLVVSLFYISCADDQVHSTQLDQDTPLELRVDWCDVDATIPVVSISNIVESNDLCCFDFQVDNTTYQQAVYVSFYSNGSPHNTPIPAFTSTASNLPTSFMDNYCVKPGEPFIFHIYNAAGQVLGCTDFDGIECE